MRERRDGVKRKLARFIPVPFPRRLSDTAVVVATKNTALCSSVSACAALHTIRTPWRRKRPWPQRLWRRGRRPKREERAAAKGGGGRGRQRGEPGRAVMGARQHPEWPPGRGGRRRPSPELGLPRRRPRYW
jgi:hypothetical protein